MAKAPSPGPPSAEPGADAQGLVSTALEAQGRGALEEAAVLFGRALELQPRDFDALHGLGCVRLQQGRFDQASALLGAAVEAAPSSALARTNLGTALGAAGDLAAALQNYDKALELEPDQRSALKGRGFVLKQLGRHAEAVAAYDQALRFEPDPQLFNDRAEVLLRLGRAQEALASAQAALLRRPKFVPTLVNCATALRSLGRLPEACESFSRALELQPANLHALYGRADVLRRLQQPAAALADLNAALAVAPKNAEVLNHRATLLKELGRDQEALADYDAAIAARPGYAEAYNNQGVLLREIGRIAEAGQAIETSIRLSPDRVRAYYDLTTVLRVEAGEPAVAALQEMARHREALAAQDRIELSFALAKVYSDLGDHESAFTWLLEGNSLKRAEVRYDEAAHLAAFARAHEVYTPALMRSLAGQGHRSDVPVFIIGMPRSGTSLVEQVLASHPKVFGAGEIHLLDDAITRLTAGTDRPIQLSAAALRSLGESYLSSIRVLAPDAARIVDKSIDNAPLAGLIHLALPDARIVHLRRDPLDTCVSCFSQLFEEGPGYAYDLGELGRRHRAHDAVMAHWKDVLPSETLLQVQYETLVSDFEGEARRIVAHCGLEWDPACLDFHLAARSVRTASASQVRRPIYRSSVGSWQVYRERLGPLMDALGQADV